MAIEGQKETEKKTLSKMKGRNTAVNHYVTETWTSSITDGREWKTHGKLQAFERS